ncbi:dihydroorotase [Moraxella bovis]|uniref:dihydroorotase n=1 Tax=Moraxella bovis TaxID=476 RepID=UPI002225EF6E|nr:dihydroorotase [Moraxella bovis]UYZ71365.1 dihydroorotase [Moraxella bovis]UYZ72722.1 dihydroorotase [Moraxella bovis]UZA14658.1 dihydroorotase [Moraxella bovis]UZA42601.1 dihydroorotase [Moraxella bovis]
MKNLLPPTWQSPTLTKSDTDGKWLIPPIVDLCGVIANDEHATIESESICAYHNGILHICTPPASSRPLDNPSLIDDIRHKASKSGVKLYAIGALTASLGGEKLANIAGLKPKTIAVSNGRCGFASDDVLLRALEYAKTFDVKVFFYPDEPSLTKNGVAHDGYVASYHGLSGIPWIAETVALAKQLLIVEETGVSAHFSQISCKSSVELIRTAKAKGLPVTCDVAMHQLHLTDDAIDGYNTLAFVYPPLRSETDKRALIKGLQDGTIDAICSHHQAVSMTAKLAPFPESTAGISNFDTFVSLGCQLVADGILTAEQLVEKICTNPAKIAGIETIYHEKGGAVLIDPNCEWTVSDETMLSMGKNTPFTNQTLVGKVEKVFFD